MEKYLLNKHKRNNSFSEIVSKEDDKNIVEKAFLLNKDFGGGGYV